MRQPLMRESLPEGCDNHHPFEVFTASNHRHNSPRKPILQVMLSTMYTWHWCAPSRTAFLTGRYPPRHGYEAGGDGPDSDGTISVAPLRFPLLPQTLKTQAGYRTVMTGKYHLVGLLRDCDACAALIDAGCPVCRVTQRTLTFRRIGNKESPLSVPDCVNTL